MNTSELISFFNIDKAKFKNSHTAGHLISFARPCIGYLVKGSGEFLYKGKTYHAEEGDLIYIAADTKYYSVWTGRPEIEFYSIDFAFNDKSSFYEYRFQILKNYPVDLFDDMYEKYKSHPFETVGIFYVILSDLFEKLQKEKITSKKIFIDPAISYIENHYTEDIQICELAKLCNCSEPHFYSLFRSVTGVSPINYKHNVLIQHALHYLAYTNLSVEEISLNLGFSSSNYFRKVFFKVTGKTPKEIRKSSQLKL